MSARRATKAGAATAHDGQHRPGVQCPWGDPQCPSCLLEFSVHIAWLATGKHRPWDDDHHHVPSRCFECQRE